MPLGILGCVQVWDTPRPSPNRFTVSCAVRAGWSLIGTARSLTLGEGAFEQLDVFHPDSASAFDDEIELDEVRFFSLFQEERRFVGGPVVGAGNGMGQPAREELAFARESAPHLQICLLGEVFRLELGAISHHALLYSGILHLKQADGLRFLTVVQPG